MDIRRVLPLGLALAALALAAPQRYEMRSYMNIGGKVQPTFAWCDAPDRVLAVTQPAKLSANPQPASLMTWLKGVKGSPTIDTVQLGPSDAGAGNIYTALTPPGVAVPTTPTSYIHTSNVENVNDPAYRMTHVNEFRLNGKSYRCRYVPQAVFLGVTAKRTVIVWESGGKATYATRNFDGTPGVYVTGGRKIANEELTAYEFKTKDGYRYRVQIATPEYGGASGVEVYQGNQPLQDESFLAYSTSLPVRGQP